MKHVFVLLAALVAPAVAVAHPLGNFTINRWTGITAARGGLTVQYVVDMAEIPTFQEMQALDADRDGTAGAAERAAYLDRLVPVLGSNLVLSVDGRAVALVPGARHLEVLPGAGGLPTLRIEATFGAPLAAGHGTVALRDRNFAGRAGWQEMIATAADGVALSGATVPAADRSRMLRVYPGDLLASPPQVAEARFAFAPGAGGPGETPATPIAGRAGAARFADRLTELVATRAPLTPGLVLTSLLLAALLGAFHAFGPGHGKTLVGAYLVGARGTAWHAVLLGLVVTATHTLGVYLLGLVTLTASHWILPERIFPWLSAASGLMVVGIGARLAAHRLDAAAGGHHHHHHGEHDHGDGHVHTHLPPDGAPVSIRSLVALGVSGGLLPCPSALVVMLGAIALGRIAFGLVLIVAFSAGLAAVLTGIGVALVHARQLFDHLPIDGRLARYAPVASAVVISVAGLAIVAQALAQIGA